MGQVIYRIFAAIGFLVVLLIALVTAAAVYHAEKKPAEPDSVILALDFDQPIVEQSDASALDLAADEDKIPLLDIVRAVDRAAFDPHVKGIVARFGSTQPSMAQVQEIRAALARFRDKGKFTYAFGANYGDFGLGNRAYYLASAFENIWLQPVGAVSLTGLAIQSPFAKDALTKIGITPDFMRREEYKSVMEMATETAFTPPVRANMQSMLDDLAGQVAGGIAESHKWDAAHVRQLMDEGPYTASEAVKAGLITHIGYRDELDAELKKKAGDDDVKQIGVEDYLAFDSSGATASPGKKTRIALIYGTGLITDRATGPDLTGEGIMGADEIAKAFDAAAKNKKIKAILFRIDSPGGSPEASETIRRAMIHAQKAGKPVFVSMGAVAASGGYWIAMNADRIIAEPGTLTGSIGVVAGKFVLAGLMQKLGVSWDTLSTSGNAPMWSMTDVFSFRQRERVNAYLDDSYRTFVQDVSAARKIPADTMPSLAKGRVFTGEQAAKNGLVDELGGYDATLAAVRKKLDLGPNDVIDLEQFPPPETATEKILGLLKKAGFESAALAQALAGWQALTAHIGPVLRDANLVHPAAAEMPAAFIGLVR